MAQLLLLYPLVILALIGVAIYQHVTISTLSLPIPPALTILTILLPLLSGFTTLTLPRLNNRNNFPPAVPRARARARGSKPRTLLLLYAAHLGQFALTTILATLFSLPAADDDGGPVATCLLQDRWTSLYRAHAAGPIRAVQDAFSCCGFRSPRDMAWPFPRGGGGKGADACEAQFGRHLPCLGPWRAALRWAGGAELAIVAVVGIVQVVGWVLVYGGVGGGVKGGRGGLAGGKGVGGGWVSALMDRLGMGGAGGGGGRATIEEERRSRRALLGAADAHGAERGREVEVEEGRGGPVEGEEEEEEDDDDNDASGAEEILNRRSPRDREAERQVVSSGYGGVGGAGPRVEPSHHDPWAGVERV